VEIAVLLKQVPATESLIEVDDDGSTIKTDGLNWVLNPYDELAVEEALQIRNAAGGAVTVFSLGPEKSVEALRTALAMGADVAVRIDPEGKTLDGLATAKVLAGELKKGAFDLIVAGHRAVDDDNFLVGPAVAEFMGIPHISMVIRQETADGKLRCTRTIEGGTVVLETALPALITTQRGLNEPRYASLPGIMKAKKKPIDTRKLSETGTDPGDPMVTTVAMRLPPQRKGGRMISGDSPADKAATRDRPGTRGHRTDCRWPLQSTPQPPRRARARDHPLSQSQTHEGRPVAELSYAVFVSSILRPADRLTHLLVYLERAADVLPARLHLARAGGGEMEASQPQHALDNRQRHEGILYLHQRTLEDVHIEDAADAHHTTIGQHVQTRHPLQQIVGHAKGRHSHRHLDQIDRTEPINPRQVLQLDRQQTSQSNHCQPPTGRKQDEP